MPGCRQASLARSGFLHIDPIRDPSEKVSNGLENVFSPTTQASGFAASPEFIPDVSSLACPSGAIERVIWIGSK